METKTLAYITLQNSLKLFLANELERKRITVHEIMAILLIFGQTSTVEEIDGFVEIFKDTFPTLGDFASNRSEGQKLEVKDKVKEVVIKILANDPMRAAQLAKDALRSDLSWEDLVAQYPELNQE